MVTGIRVPDYEAVGETLGYHWRIRRGYLIFSLTLTPDYTQIFPWVKLDGKHILRP